MALPSIATLLDFKIPQTNVIISEEETHSPSFVVYEKAIPKMLDVHEFVKFFETRKLAREYSNAYNTSGVKDTTVYNQDDIAGNANNYRWFVFII